MLSNEDISPVGLFYAIFRLTDFSSEAFDFSSTVKRDQRTLSTFRAFHFCFSQSVMETYTYGVKGGS